MNILILVHPDCLSEQYIFTPEQSGGYLEKLEEHLPKFDYVIVMRMDRVNKEWIEGVKSPQIKQHFYKLEEIVNQHADLQVTDNDLGKTALNKEIGDFLLENPNSTVYLSGGYQDNCLRDVAANLVSELGDFLKELDIKVRVYKPLVYYYSRGLGFEELKEAHPWWDVDWIEKYQEDRKNPPESRKYRDWASEGPYREEEKRGEDGWWEGPHEALAQLKRNYDYTGNYLDRVRKLNRKRRKKKLKAFLRIAYVRQEGSQWFVYSHEGKKLSKGYPSKKQAEERLHQIEYFKHKDKRGFLAKRLRVTTAHLRKKAVKEYFDEEEIMELLSDSLPDLKIEKKPGEERDFAGTPKKKLPFAYGNIPNYTNPADDMAWDIIIVPSAVDLPKEELMPVGILRYNRDVDFWDTLPGDDPIGNDKILLGKRSKDSVGELRGEYTKEDLDILNDHFKDTKAFESPELIWDYV